LCIINWPFQLLNYEYSPGDPALELPFPTLIESCKDNGKKIELFFMFEAQAYPVVDLNASTNFWTFFTDLHVWDG
jgi:hypothetical protein